MKVLQHVFAEDCLSDAPEVVDVCLYCVVVLLQLIDPVRYMTQQLSQATLSAQSWQPAAESHGLCFGFITAGACACLAALSMLPSACTLLLLLLVTGVLLLHALTAVLPQLAKHAMVVLMVTYA